MERWPLAALLLTPAAASGPAAQPSPVVVELSNFRFAPATIRLAAGKPVVIRLRNAGGAHSFAAPAFFAAARLDPASASLVQRGRVEVPKGAIVDLALTPAAGRYRLKCTHTLHPALGMKGWIEVR